MTQLDVILEVLQALDAGVKEQPEQVSSVVPSLAEERDSFISAILSAVRTSFNGSYEARNYYDIVGNLINVLKLKLQYSDKSFLQISGIRLSSSKVKLRVISPNLSSLGSYADWLDMQKSGQNLFKTTRVTNPSSGWRSYYLSYISGSGPRSDVYPAIMQKRMAWATGKKLAPYWYWYDKSVSTSEAYPRQDVLDFSGDIRKLAQALVNKINQESYTTESSILIDELNLSLGVQDQLNEILDGTPVPKRDIVTGHYKDVVITQEGVLQLLKKKDVAAGSSFQRGTKRVVQLYDTKTGRFTGLRRELENL